MARTPQLIVCGECYKPKELSFDQEDWKRWKAGTLIQDAMPYLTLDERELLISGTCGGCFDKMCASSQDEQDEPDDNDESNRMDGELS